jgi:hypothetical protein
LEELLKDLLDPLIIMEKHKLLGRMAHGRTMVNYPTGNPLELANQFQFIKGKPGSKNLMRFQR